jgi:NADH-quinone oxidoreductase subunit G
MENVKTITIDGREIPLEGEKNLLEVIRKAGIDIPTFCYVSELSVYGACRMCTVDIEGRGLQTSCSTPPEPGMKVRTSTEPVRQIRKVALEFFLANHERECTTCSKSLACKLQDLSKKLGVGKVRFRSVQKSQPINESVSIVREPNKCILCGDCVRMCSEVQGIGAIDFAFRGHDVRVQPAFGKSLDEVNCVFCGQCVRVCPTGALAPKSETEAVWKDLHNPQKVVVAQIAPAVRVALGEAFGYQAGEVTTGQIIAALKMMGFDKVYDTCFAADLTIMEEGNEFIQRATHGGVLPMFTSCCPGWVKYVEQHHPDIIPHLSSCKSPQQMFGSVAKEVVAQEMGVKREDMVVVSIMPCTAKKFEAKRPEFSHDGLPEVDHVITTQELVAMINEHGIQFRHLKPESLDMPLGFKTGAGVIFGNSGGVMEAALRYVYEKVEDKILDNCDFHEVRGEAGIREAEVHLAGKTYKLAVVHSLGNAKKLLEKIKAGKSEYHFIEVMACPGGCINGGGQPVSARPEARARRTAGLYEADKALQLHKSQENPYILELYAKSLGAVGGNKAHHLLHTHYSARRRILGESLDLSDGPGKDKVEVKVCMGTSCYLKGSQDLLHRLARYVAENRLQAEVQPKASFCFEACDQGPTVQVGDQVLHRCDLDQAVAALEAALDARRRSQAAV